MEQQEEEIKYDKLDILYNTSVRCPYCKARIVKYTSTCPRCGVQKQQIYHASNVKAKEALKNKTGEKVFLTARRPSDVSFTGMVLMLLIGFTGLHCFKVGRKIRGWIYVATVVLVFIYAIWFSIDEEYVMSFDGGFWGMFPLMWAVPVMFALWAYDWLGVVFNYFKYPVRLGEAVKGER